MVKQQHQLFVGLLCLTDGVVVACAALAAWAVRRSMIERFAVERWETYFKESLVLFAVPITLHAMWMFRLYRPARDRSLGGEFARIVKASLAAMAGMVLILWLVGNSAVRGGANYGTVRVLGVELEPGRLQLGVLAVLLPLMLLTHRWAFRSVLRYVRRRGWNLRHVAIIGVGRLGQIACRTLGRNTWTGLNVSYFIAHHDRTHRTSCLQRPVRGGLERLEETLEQHPVDAVYLAIPTSHAARLPKLLKRLEKFAVDVRIIPDVHPRLLPQSMTVSELEGMPILSYRECPLYGVGGLTKRAMDIAGAGLGLLVFSPLMALIAAGVAMGSPGPIIYRQRRVSLGGETFWIYKFRTMRCDVDAPDECDGWTRRDDPRITRIGRWLRRTSLDELPQLVNVLLGDMSLVGPRPERPELIEQFREDWRGYMLRQHVRAGMTGWAQVNGHRGDTGLKKRLQHDLYYVRHWSVWFDVRILWLTLFRGFVHDNAH